MCETKTCTRCGETKLLTEFYKRNTGSVDGFTGTCKACVAERGKLRFEKLKTNPEKLKARYARGNSNEKTKAYKKNWQKANPEKMRAYKLKWQQANPEKVRAIQARRRPRLLTEADKAFKKNWQKAHPEKVRAYKLKWQKANPEKAHIVDVRQKLKRKIGLIPSTELLETVVVLSLIKKELRNEHSRTA